MMKEVKIGTKQKWTSMFLCPKRTKSLTKSAPFAQWVDRKIPYNIPCNLSVGLAASNPHTQ
jgi:hypothetical protein